MADHNLTDDLFDFLEEDGFTTPPISSKLHPEGKRYRISSPDGETGLALAALGDIGVKLNKGVDISERDLSRLKLDDEQEAEFAEKVLGDTYAEMVADGVSWVRIQRLMSYAYVRFAFSEEVANEAAARGQFSGKAPARNRAQRRAEGRTSGGAHRGPQGSTATRAPRV